MRKILFIRHAIAEDLGIAVEKGINDTERSLTKTGSLKMAQVAKGLKVIVPELDYIATSPLTRAVQTAEIICKEYRGLRPALTDVLYPDLDFHNFINWMKQTSENILIAIVGHEPDLSMALCRLLTGNEQVFLHFKKGGAGLIEIPENSEPGDGRLVWFLTPQQLRQIGTTIKS